MQRMVAFPALLALIAVPLVPAAAQEARCCAWERFTAEASSQPELARRVSKIGIVAAYNE